MKLKYLSVLAIGLVLQLSRVQAQELLTLQQAIKFALENKADAKKSKLDVINAQNKIDEVRSGALPQVNLSAGVTYNPIIQQVALDGALMGKPGETVLVTMGQRWQSTPTLSLNQQLFNQTVFTGLKAANTTREFYIINDQLTEEQLIEKVANAYYDVYTSQLNLQTVQTNIDNASKNQKIIEGLFQAGLAKKIDLDRIVVNINNLKAQKQQLINGLELKENALKFALGMDITKPIEMPKETFKIDAEVLHEVADVSNRTEVKVLEKQLELLDLNMKAEKSAYYPTLSLTANYGYTGFGAQFPIFNNHPSVNWANFSSVGLNLAFPVFNGFKTRSKVRQANVDIKKAEIDLMDTKLALSLGNENAKAQVKNSLLTVNTNQANVQLAKEVLDNTSNNYRNGLATLTELLDAEQAYADSQNNLNTSLLNYKVAEIQLVKANGKLKTLVNE
ncbi:TolC family protein [Sphingobacterium psychroaquaticum]|uniref:Outer membrane protein TolC n=1 Tax=Sphingobacterium psychroaquaticum TaxID=561061 RepID=A0A1X7JN18_9SPHI|nr:TolC family protein [Sphingobacterium psychroaquaticum]QBQ40887.1 TolC family protein [Sphingobacterium psychroaquaticum]SMG29610.1 Outer membrane protein TolC [Sphingobacterium psychroaquaticum]